MSPRYEGKPTVEVLEDVDGLLPGQLRGGQAPDLRPEPEPVRRSAVLLLVHGFHSSR
jgi:hypothetical protein